MLSLWLLFNLFFTDLLYRNSIIYFLQIITISCSWLYFLPTMSITSNFRQNFTWNIFPSFILGFSPFISYKYIRNGITSSNKIIKFHLKTLQFGGHPSIISNSFKQQLWDDLLCFAPVNSSLWREITIVFSKSRFRVKVILPVIKEDKSHLILSIYHTISK